jgi:uncharacterized protein YndB with AHSA1/START domain
MFQVTVTTIINRPIEEVFAFIADNENDPKWCVPVIETKRIQGESPGANTQYSFVGDLGYFLKSRGELQILAFAPPKRITWKGQSTINRFEGEYLLQAEEGGTRLTEKSTIEARGLFRLFESSMQREVEQGYTKQLSNLKILLEENHV